MLSQDIGIESQEHHYGVTVLPSIAPIQRVPLKSFTSHVGAVLGERIRAEIERLRVVRGWSRPELGRRLNPPTSGQQIERLEKGQRDLDTKWIEKIAKALGVDPAVLVAGEEQQYELTPQVATEVAEHLARLALRGEEPDPAIVQDLAIVIQELSATFAADPQSRHDPQLVRPVARALVRQRGRQSS